MLLTFVYLFLIAEALMLMLIAAAIYVSPLGARRTDVPPVVLPMAIVKPTKWRRNVASKKNEIAVRERTYQRLHDYARRQGTQLRVVVDDLINRILDEEERKN